MGGDSPSVVQIDRAIVAAAAGVRTEEGCREGSVLIPCRKDLWRSCVWIQLKGSEKERQVCDEPP
jgi:hypothetical protein